MNYLIKKTYSLSNQPFAKLYGTSMALVEPDAESRALYSQKLKEVNVNVEAYSLLEDLLAAMQENQFHVVILSPKNKDLPILERMREQWPHIPLVTISKMMSEEDLDGIMKIGVAMHVNRDLTRPRDLLVALEQVLSLNN
ncbi:MAG: hypothetical protein R3B41_04025 [Candidatus Doudnabacteria bacterium]